MANEFKVGDKVVFVDENEHDERFCPPVGTVGTLLYKASDSGKFWLVQWPDGSTTHPENKDRHLCMSSQIRKVEN